LRCSVFVKAKMDSPRSFLKQKAAEADKLEGEADSIKCEFALPAVGTGV
jgi:hypothetical protein